MSSAQKQPIFTIEQIEWLDKMFPETTMLVEHDEMIYHMGKRHVLTVIKEVSKVRTRNVSVQSDLS